MKKTADQLRAELEAAEDRMVAVAERLGYEHPMRALTTEVLMCYDRPTARQMDNVFLRIVDGDVHVYAWRATETA